MSEPQFSRVPGTLARDVEGEILIVPVRERVVEGIKAAGFTYVAVDVEGFRSGSLNEDLDPA